MVFRKLSLFTSRIWIAVLALLSIVAVTCSTSRKANKTGNNDTIQTQIDSINQIINHREVMTIYGPPDVMKNYGKETQRLRNELDSLNNQLRK